MGYMRDSLAVILPIHRLEARVVIPELTKLGVRYLLNTLAPSIALRKKYTDKCNQLSVRL